MPLSLTFRFADDELNDKLIDLVKKARIKHSIDESGVLHYAPVDEEYVENELIGSIRAQAYSSWQVLSCPQDWTVLYRKYMSAHGIPFHEELINNELWFLIPRKYRPNLWKFTAKKSRSKVRLAH